MEKIKKTNKSPRNGFDMSYHSYFTSPTGMLLPAYVLYWSYPSLFEDLPRYLPVLKHAEYVSLHLHFFSIGYDLSEFYDSSGVLS